MARTAHPEDLASFVVPTDPRLSPDGRTGFFNSDETGTMQAYMVRGWR